MKTKLVGLSALCIAANCFAQFDVNYTPVPPTFVPGFDGTTHVYAQTFTINTGGRLTGVDLYISSIDTNATLLWDVRPTLGGVPVAANSSALASGSISTTVLTGSYTPSFFHFDLTAFNLAVSTGNLLSIVVRGTDGNTVGQIYGTTTDAYGGGMGFIGSASGGSIAWTTLASYDFGVRTTVVPEPASWSVIAGAAALLVAWRRRKQPCRS